MSKLLTLHRDVRDVRLACFASFTSCLRVPENTCETEQAIPVYLGHSQQGTGPHHKQQSEQPQNRACIWTAARCDG